MTMTRIDGKVAQVLSNRQIVINAGRRDGVELGMRFAVLASEPLEIRDPESHEILGKVDREKFRVNVVEVEDRLATCQTYETALTGGAASWALEAGNSRMWSPIRRVPKPLKAEDIPTPLSSDQLIIRVGDRVRRVADDPALAEMRQSVS